jgi:hypothetical protein
LTDTSQFGLRTQILTWLLLIGSIHLQRERLLLADVSIVNFKYFPEEGQILEHIFAVTHSSEANYTATAEGDYFGLNGNQFIQVPKNVSTIVDLLEDKGISWGFYQEDSRFLNISMRPHTNETQCRLQDIKDFPDKPENPRTRLRSQIQTWDSLELRN